VTSDGIMPIISSKFSTLLLLIIIAIMPPA
jgi:hypothetical protein